MLLQPPPVMLIPILAIFLACIPGLQTRTTCDLSCGEDRNNPVCGTNSKTYISRCELQKDICKGIVVELRHPGYCKQGVFSRCLEERRNAVRTSAESGIPIFVPECKKDGDFNPVQCHKGTGYCWCVNQTGKPVPGTSVHNARPVCTSPHDTSRYRRGKGRSGSKRSRKKGRVKICTQIERNGLSSNLKDMVGAEYRSFYSAKGRHHSGISNANKEIMEWKFDQMDEDRDGILTRKEFRTFRKQVKTMLRPKRCSRNLQRICDINSDSIISKQEWRTCVGLEQNISFKLFLSLSSDEDESKRRSQKDQKNDNTDDQDMLDEEHTFEDSLESIETEEDLEDHQNKDFTGLAMNQAVGSGLFAGATRISEAGTRTRENGEEVTCVSERSQATAEARSGNDAIFIPECKPNGAYLDVQCHKSTGYCWCVDSDNGRPVAGTSTKHNKPDCAKPARKEWAKCEGGKRDQFLSHLKQWLRDQMGQASYSYHRNPGVSFVDQSVMWKFSLLDKNKDGVLRRKEMSSFKSELRRVEGLKFCGKRLNKYCDLNSDKRISVEEWRTCLDVGAKKEPTSLLNPSSRRRGPNPLNTWLKGDR